MNKIVRVNAAVAKQNGAVDARDHHKNGASLKSQTSRENFLTTEVI